MSAPVNFCRICFRNNNILRKLHELDIDGVRLSDKLKACVPEIIYTSELEKYESICIECCQFLKTAYMFKELCIRSNILLQGCLNKEKHPLENLQNLSNHFLDQTSDDNQQTIEVKQEPIVIKEEYSSLPEQFNTYLSDSENSLDDKGSKNSSQSNESADSTISLQLKNLIEARKEEELAKRGTGAFSCDLCGRRFTKKTYLKKHLQIHSDYRPFVCYLCNMTFNRKNTLETHLLIHTGVKNYTCNVCSKSFRLKCALDRHLLIHSNYKAYKCKICGKGFGRKDHLEKHGRVHRHLYAELNKIETEILRP